jgi:hypothetical protein
MTYYFGTYDAGGVKAKAEACLSFANLQTDTHSNIWIFPQIGGVKVAVNAGTRIEDWFTEKAMLARGRR